MKSLYIIGNGFDRYHDLDTRYQAFAFYLQAHYVEIYDYLIEYYGLPDIDKDDDDCLDYHLWSDFEKTLADIDFQSILDDNLDYLPNISSDDFRDGDWHTYEIAMELIVNKLTKDLFKAFKEFVLNIQFPKYIGNKKLNLNKQGIFLNFNYTDTLEYFYNISDNNIFYIHHKAKDLNATLVLGHGIHPSNFVIQNPQPPNGLSDEEYDEWYKDMRDNYDYSYESGRAQLFSYFAKSFKDSESIIQENLVFFQNLHDVNEVFILGHSLSEVDTPYLSKIIESMNINKVKWTVTYYELFEKESHLQKLLNLGLRNDLINLIEMSDLRLSF